MFWRYRPPKYLADIHPLIILEVQTPQIFDGHTSVKYFGRVDPPNIWRTYICKFFWRCRPPKYLTDIHPFIILEVQTPQIFDGHTSVKYFGGVDPPNI